MNPERWQRLKEIVADALEHGADERAGFLANACAEDPELLREAESMLKHASDETWIEGFVDELSSSRSDAVDSRIGQRVGAYRIVGEIGRGGMGAVYLAERADEQFKKQVAIKILKRGTDTEEVLRRFRYEKEILARLEHPNIARLMDAGTTDDGLPYFAMEYVSGRPITDFCEAEKLNLRARIELFLKVCAAVQFAHRNLIVHRDLKPGNILVTAEGEPKLLDFGIAKLLAPDAVTMQMTQQDRQRLTPGYASPEQVRGEPITTVSDVYSLGALLCEILAGSPPHRFSTPHPSPTEVFRVVAEQETPRPSSLAAKAEQQRELRGDLDNILLTALRKEPKRRYSGVTAFSDDLRRYLDGRPVRAHKATLAYRASKFVQRNKLGVAAAAILLLTLLGGISATAWQARKATIQKGRAEERFNQVRKLAHSVLFDYHDQIAALPGATAVRGRLVRDALEYLDNLSKEAGDDRALLREVAEAYEKVGAVQGGAAAVRGTTIAAANLGDTAGAVVSQEKAITIREHLVTLGRSDPADLQALALGYVKMSAPFILAGPPQTAVEYLRKAIPIIESLLAANPGNEDLRALAQNAYISMARSLGSPAGPNLGDPAGALQYISKAMSMQEGLVADYPANLSYKQVLGTTHNAMGLICSALGRKDEQLEHNRKAVEIARSLVAAQPDNAFYRRELAVLLGNLGRTLVESKDNAGVGHLREALAIFEALVAADPSDVSIRKQWAIAHRNVGTAVGTSNRTEAMQHFEKAIEILKEIVAKDQKNLDFQRQLAQVYLAKSRFKLEVEDAAAAVASADEGIKIVEQVIAASPADVAAQNTLAQLFTQFGAAHVKIAQQAAIPDAQQHWHGAKAAYSKSLAVYQGMKAKGTLSNADAPKLDEVSRAIADCDTALKLARD